MSPGPRYNIREFLAAQGMKRETFSFMLDFIAVEIISSVVLVGK